MAISTHIDPGTGARTHTVTGDLKVFDVRRTLEDAYARPEFRPEAAALWDLREATGDVPTEDVRHLVDFVTKLVGDGDQGKVAIVVPSDLDFGLSKMYETILGGQSRKPMKVFGDIDEAQSWLDDIG
jgi:hypothetical protein